MKYHYLLAFIFLSQALGCISEQEPEKTYNAPLDFVDIFYGSANSNFKPVLPDDGVCIPSIGLPYANTSFTLNNQSGEGVFQAPYVNNPELPLYGIRATHWNNSQLFRDFGSINCLPIFGELNEKSAAYNSHYTIEKATAGPTYIKIKLKDYPIDIEVTPALHGCMMNLSYRETGMAHIIIHPNTDAHNGSVSIDPMKSEVFANNGIMSDFSGQLKYENYAGNFYLKGSVRFSECGYWRGELFKRWDDVVAASAAGEPLTAFVSYKVNKGDKVQIKWGASFSDLHDAIRNVEVQMPDWNFDNLRTSAEEIWTEQLDQVQIETKDQEQKIAFYSAYYQTLQTPRIFSDVDGRYVPFGKQYLKRYSKENPQYFDFAAYFGFRNLYPLKQLLEPERYDDFMHSIIQKSLAERRLPQNEMLNTEGYFLGRDPFVFLIQYGLEGAHTDSLKSILENHSNMLRNMYKNGTYQPTSTADLSIAIESHYSNLHLQEFAQTQELIGVYDSLYSIIKSKPQIPGFHFYTANYLDSLASWFGGKDALIKELDEYFTNEYLHQSQEQWYPFIYSYLGEPEKTASAIEQIKNKFYADKANLSAHDMAWLVWVNLGCYPIDAAANRWIGFKPVLEQANISIGNTTTKLSRP